MQAPVPKPVFRSFEVRELAFFWRPRNWKEIVARFGEDRTGSSDIRDAIIEVDDEGGHSFLHWFADRKSWGLTDKGKHWVQKLVSTGFLARERDWEAPVEIELPEPPTPEPRFDDPLPEPGAGDGEDLRASGPEGHEPGGEDPEAELARLAAEQALDDEDR